MAQYRLKMFTGDERLVFDQVVEAAEVRPANVDGTGMLMLVDDIPPDVYDHDPERMLRSEWERLA